MKNAIRMISAVLLLTFVVMFIPAAYAQNEIKILVNGKPLQSDIAPMVINGVTMVPMRAIGNALGYSVVWNEEKKTVSLGYGPDCISFGPEEGPDVIVAEIGDPYIIKIQRLSGILIREAAVAPMIVNGRALVPLRTICLLYTSRCV